MAHATLVKFGYPRTCLRELEHWFILLRPSQVTLGALVLCAKSDGESFASLPKEAFTELHQATAIIEKSLTSFRPFNKINYLALMMVDPHVHFHVLPRYSETQLFAGIAFPDNGWPGVPDLKAAPDMPEKVRDSLQKSLVDLFSRPV